MQKLENWRIQICGCTRQGLKVIPWCWVTSGSYYRISREAEVSTYDVGNYVIPVITRNVSKILCLLRWE